MNLTVKNQTSLEDFEEFDLRDAINVVVYGFMSLGELVWSAEVLLTLIYLISWDGTEWSRPGDCCQTVRKVLPDFLLIFESTKNTLQTLHCQQVVQIADGFISSSKCRVKLVMKFMSIKSVYFA